MADDFSEPKRRGCIVVIAMDGSLHSLHAFECKFLLSFLKNFDNATLRNAAGFVYIYIFIFNELSRRFLTYFLF